MARLAGDVPELPADEPPTAAVLDSCADFTVDDCEGTSRARPRVDERGCTCRRTDRVERTADVHGPADDDNSLNAAVDDPLSFRRLGCAFTCLMARMAAANTSEQDSERRDCCRNRRARIECAPPTRQRRDRGGSQCAHLHDPSFFRASAKLLRRARTKVKRRKSKAAHTSSGSRCSSASTRAKPLFAPSSTPYCIVVSRSSVVVQRIVCISFVWSPRSSTEPPSAVRDPQFQDQLLDALARYTGTRIN